MGCLPRGKKPKPPKRKSFVLSRMSAEQISILRTASNLSFWMNPPKKPKGAVWGLFEKGMVRWQERQFGSMFVNGIVITKKGREVLAQIEEQERKKQQGETNGSDKGPDGAV